MFMNDLKVKMQRGSCEETVGRVVENVCRGDFCGGATVTSGDAASSAHAAAATDRQAGRQRRGRAES